MSVIDAIGLVSGIFGIIGFLQDNAPSKPEVEGAKIRVKVGLQHAEDDPSVVSTVSVLLHDRSSYVLMIT
jgi:hypothetical protein